MADRRTVLSAALTLGAAGLAGCSAPTSSSTGAGSATTTASKGTTIAAASVPVGGGVVAGSFIVTQPTQGTFAAYSYLCPHQGCPVTRIDAGQAICGCHNSVFSLADGSRVSGPANSGLKAAKATVADGQVTVTA
nr:Rieske 2Fe-2S domain-containing protein [Propionibacterium sp.]